MKKTIHRALLALSMLAALLLLIPARAGAAELLRPGSTGYSVRVLQTNLKGLGYGGTVTGTFDEKTHAAVYWYQSSRGLGVDGIAGPETQNTLKADMKEVQEGLNTLGYSSGTADGIYGANTASAITRFQKAEGLSADGIAGSRTRSALKLALEEAEKEEEATETDSLAAFQQYALANWSAPIRASFLPVTGGRTFGYRRPDGRQHAAIDYYVHNGAGTPVYAMTSGTVTGVSTTFYAGTGAVTVQNTDGSVIRYGEIKAAVKNGAKVKKGQVIGYLAANTVNGGTMLHLELYRGDASGLLTQTGNTSYTYVSGRFNRRADLLDPTFLLALSE